MSEKKGRLWLNIAFCALCFYGGNRILAEEADLEDPTKPSDFVGSSTKGTGEDTGDLRLEAIIISGAHTVAVINQKILAVGDTIGTKKIIAIEEKKVVLREGKNKDTVLPLLEKKVKEVSL